MSSTWMSYDRRMKLYSILLEQTGRGSARLFWGIYRRGDRRPFQMVQLCSKAGANTWRAPGRSVTSSGGRRRMISPSMTTFNPRCRACTRT
jgi:hypothetical protein